MMLSSIASTTRMKSSRLHSLPHRGTWALVAVLTVSAGLNFWNLSANGWANAFYTAAVQSGLHDGESFLFGSSDWGNSISVDKPPLSLWLMGISVRLLGFNSWGILVPQALLGVATTWLIYIIVRRRASFWPSLIAAFAYATTPIVVLLSRYNNPDPLLVFLMVLALEATMRGIEARKVRWFFLVGVLLGLGFLTKQLQVLLIAPALALSALWGLGMGWRKTLAAASASVASFVALSGGWIAFVDLIPSDMRPYIGSSKSNSLAELTLGYNGISRITDNDAVSTARTVVSLIPQKFVGTGNDSGLLRLFNGNYNQEASWLLPLGIVGSVVIVWALRRTTAAKLATAAAAWLLTAYLLLSFMGTDIHTYYTMNLSAPLALTVGLTWETFNKLANRRISRTLIALGVGLSFLLAWLTLGSIDDGGFSTYGAWSTLGLGVIASILIAVPSPFAIGNKLAAILTVAGLAVGPVVTDVATINSSHVGSNPISGSLTENPTTMSHFLDALSRGEPKWASDISRGAPPSLGLVHRLEAEPGSCRWAAATYPAQTAANWQLAVNRPVMPIGGFSASDPSPTLDEFKRLVEKDAICYFIDYPELDPVIAPQTSAGSIVSWIRSTHVPVVVDGLDVYPLTGEG